MRVVRESDIPGGDEITIEFCSHDHVLLEFEPAVSARQWRVVIRRDQPARWQRTAVAHLVTVPATRPAPAAEPDPRARQLILDLHGQLDQAALVGLRAALGLRRRGRLTDAEDAEFGYRTDPPTAVHLWRHADDKWQITIEATGDAPLPDAGLTGWAELATGAAVAAGLTPEGPPRVPPPAKVRPLSVLLRQQLSTDEVGRLCEELALARPVDASEWDVGRRVLSRPGEPAVVLWLRRPAPRYWALSVDAVPAAVVAPADVDRWFAQVTAAVFPQ